MAEKREEENKDDGKDSHLSVMTKEVLEVLNVHPGQWYVDATLGQGGHARAILEAGGSVIAIDRDPKAIEKARLELLPIFGERLRLTCMNHAGMGEFLPSMRVDISGVVLDSGWSMAQASENGAGLSFDAEGPLDMRMDPTLERTAMDILEQQSAEELAAIFSNFGEEPLALPISRALVQSRSRGRLPRTPKELAAFVSGVYYRKGYRRSRRHPATRVFMALRIEVNGEIDSLVRGVSGVRSILGSGARLAVLTFHSREDREIKHLFREWVREGWGRLLQSKPVLPGKAEIEHNPRSRSAKLRVYIAN
ncbi:16S rRNA (cytosine(1402)-N(4))-methyltransferase RsmH [Leptospirillum ferriphilum]|uniref:Ribosomal RNA small subunit methyltransferase H n=2 Tax=Leptospirillum ferriphilum TaxID=178606 RepID=A0A1V3SWG2_9BACT|nr:16S rRNA (cytosine(1402)-N(4))-methyltransferase RsmH [Leptospirillum ferriphilum]AFS53064.1 putative S-adenosylmethionine-dependent methyltransferase [Leptospirillum ferriphilum ML-04]OOH73278.1 16S rRNA (cytosine(1402)-N(4))-methyltransferase [Leptospirillum ferriphilum]